MTLMIKKILILILCLFVVQNSAQATNIPLDENQSKVTYTLTAFSIPFKRKPLPASGTIYFNQDLSLFKGINLKCKFTSVNPIFRKFINFDKYPYFQFSGNLENPISLKGKKIIELTGDISFHGVTKKTKVKLKNNSNDNLISFIGFVNIKMTDFGLKPPRFLFLSVDNPIKTKFELIADKNGQ